MPPRRPTHRAGPAPAPRALSAMACGSPTAPARPKWAVRTIPVMRHRPDARSPGRRHGSLGGPRSPGDRRAGAGRHTGGRRSTGWPVSCGSRDVLRRCGARSGRVWSTSSRRSGGPARVHGRSGTPSGDCDVPSPSWRPPSGSSLPPSSDRSSPTAPHRAPPSANIRPAGDRCRRRPSQPPDSTTTTAVTSATSTPPPPAVTSTGAARPQPGGAAGSPVLTKLHPSSGVPGQSVEVRRLRLPRSVRPYPCHRGRSDGIRTLHQPDDLHRDDPTPARWEDDGSRGGHHRQRIVESTHLPLR